jgi:glucose-6-phosphate 1-epimerase
MNQYAIPNALHIETNPGGLARAVISTPLADAEVYLQGAHVTRWAPKGQRPVLFLSSTSAFAPGKAIRGGIPVIFPWFGPRSDGKPGPAHGYARTSLWTLESTRLVSAGEVEVTLALAAAEAPGARLRVYFGEALRLELQVRNDSPVPFRFENAFHSYFTVPEIGEISVTGLEETTYIDKTDGLARKLHHAEPVRFTREIDHMHLNTAATCVIHDPVWNRRIIVEKTGSNSTVVWNPWSEKAAAMADMGPDEWRHMICVESANAADNAITLAPGATHTLTTTIRLG